MNSKRLTPILTALTFSVILVAGAAAQSVPPQAPAAEDQADAQQTSSAEVEDRRPATSTFFGDTGLWFVPTAEVLAHGRWSASGYRRGTNYVQGFANVGDFAGTFAVGVADRLELFASFLFDTRVERDLRPIFTNDPDVGGILERHPRAATGWTGDNVGDLYLGAKVNLLSQTRGHPAALAIRGMVKAPTGDSDIGASTGATDVSLDVIVSREFVRVAEFAGHAGYEFRGQPDGFVLSDGAVKWGVGAAFPSRSPLRATLELSGLVPNADTATLAGATLVGADGSLPPLASTIRSLTRATVGINWQASNGFFIGAGYTWDIPREDRSPFTTDEDGIGDFADLQVRLGYHPGVRQTQGERLAREQARRDQAAADEAARKAADEAARKAAADEAARKAAADEAARKAAADEAARKAAADEAARKAAADEAARKSIAFEDVHFDFDRYSLRPDAARLLDDAVTALSQNPTLNLQIEGHTCNIGTAEYNLALGDRRASAVREYLISRGVAAGRLTTISYGEERPRHDNSREETRRLNRRAALVVRLQ
jgi:outer membrane protein OmpA-like peptidoglycan-associated protein